MLYRILDILKDIIYWLFDIFRDIGACFTRNIGITELLNIYWFMFLIEMPRYYLFDGIIILYHKLTFKKRDRIKNVAKRMLHIENPLVTILVPGKNEGKHIYKLCMSLAEQTYRNYEIIVVDDGSDDDTYLICSDLEKNGLIDKFLSSRERGGKASAANFGLYYAKGKYIIHLDADSSLDRDAIENILIPFYLDEEVKGVGGCVKVRNYNDNICTSLQAIEYLKTIMVGRTVTSTLGIYHIISGAFGAFDTAALRSVGAWDIGPGLDGDVTQKLRKAGYKVEFATDAICLTNVPTKWRALFKQRLRWSRSLIRFRVRKHRDILLITGKNGNFLNFVSNAENILYDCVFNYMWLFYILGLLFQYTDRLLEILTVGWLIRLALANIGFLILIALTERPREEWKLIRFLPLTIFYTGYFMRIIRLIGHTSELFFFKSYEDTWNPQKTSVYARVEGQ